MSWRKYAADGTDSPPSKKQGVTAKTVEKWISVNDKALNTVTWLKYEKADREYVDTLKCCVYPVRRQVVRYVQLQCCIYRQIEKPASV